MNLDKARGRWMLLESCRRDNKPAELLRQLSKLDVTLLRRARILEPVFQAPSNGAPDMRLCQGASESCECWDRLLLPGPRSAQSAPSVAVKQRYGPSLVTTSASATDGKRSGDHHHHHYHLQCL